jgi:hypothetical protein
MNEVNLMILYKKFTQIKQCIDEADFPQANYLLAELKPLAVSKYSRLLHEKYHGMLPKKNINKIKPIYPNGTLTNYDDRALIPGTSIVSCCMNRNRNLKKALATWVKLPVDEIIIVDWSSVEPVIDTVAEFNDSRIKVIRVDNEPKWILTYGFNVGLRFASYSKVYKFDADIEVSEDFLILNQITTNQFVRGYWKSALEEGLASQVYVNGSFGCYKKNLLDIGFYNELIRTYGWDDSDLYERLSSECGLATKYLDFKSVVHLEQEAAERIANQDVNPDAFLDLIPTTEFNNHSNKFIGRTTDYWNTNRLQNYSIVKKTAQLWQCERISDEIHIPHFLINDANIYACIHYMWSHSPQILKNSLSVTNAAALIFNEYSAKIAFDMTLNLLGLRDSVFHLSLFTAQHTSYENFLQSCLWQAKNTNEPVFSIAIGNEFNHQSIGGFGQRVEVITMPKELALEVINSRQKNKVQNVEVEQRTWLSEEQYLSTLQRLQKRYVYVDAQHGLGNRLRAIASAATIANKLNRELIIVWQADDHCECDFSDLYDYQGTVIDKSFVLEAEKQMSVFNYMEIEANGKKDEEIVVDQNKDLYLRAAYTFNSEHSNWNDENEYLRNLTPCEAVQSLISDFELENHIAAHIRMEGGAGFEDKSYESMDNWTEEGHDELTKWRQASHFSNFIKRIDTLLEQEPQRKLFLATDMPETYQEFERYYGNKLSYLKRDVYDRSKEQIIFGLADAILLSRSQRLLGSTWSSFSELAMRLSTRFSSIEMSGKDF